MKKKTLIVALLLTIIPLLVIFLYSENRDYKYTSTYDELLIASESDHFKDRAKFTINFLKEMDIRKPILDIGARSPITEILEISFNVDIDNTDGDLDLPDFSIPQCNYKTVLYLHTIEHQFNPLITLLRLRKFITLESRIFIALPRRSFFLQAEHTYHFHEIGENGFKNLCKRANYEIVNITTRRWKQQISGLRGIRPLFRYFLDKEVIYELRLK